MRTQKKEAACQNFTSPLANCKYSPRLADLVNSFAAAHPSCRIMTVPAMYRMFYPIVALTVVLVGGIIWLISTPPAWWSQVSATLASVTGRSPTAKSAPPSTSPEKPNPLGRKKASHPGQSDWRVEILESNPSASAPAATERPPFPAAQDVQPGTARSVILKTFVPPGATVTGADVGQLRERFIYIDKTTGRKTVIFLTNGFVSSIESTN
jgi:hypothetical protein